MSAIDSNIMAASIIVRVQAADFNPGTELEQLVQGRPQIGAVVSFIGLVRDQHEGAQIRAVTLEHYPQMTRKMIEKIVAKAMARWELSGAVVIHRFGRLLPQDRIVFVAVASAHRAEAFKAAEFIIDFLKTEAPFWKKEETGTGARWVAARSGDELQRNRWEND